MAQGTVYLLLRRRTANILDRGAGSDDHGGGALRPGNSPLDLTQAEPFRHLGRRARLVLGAIVQPVHQHLRADLSGGRGDPVGLPRSGRTTGAYHRFVGNVYIAVGALLPAIGGSFTRFGYTDVLYVTELVGLSFIYIGYRYNVR